MSVLSREQWRAICESRLSVGAKMALAELAFHGEAEIHKNDVAETLNETLNDVEGWLAELQRTDNAVRRRDVYNLVGGHKALPAKPKKAPAKPAAKKTVKS